MVPLLRKKKKPSRSLSTRCNHPWRHPEELPTDRYICHIGCSEDDVGQAPDLYFFASAAFLPAQYFFILALTAFFCAADMVERFFVLPRTGFSVLLFPLRSPGKYL